MKISCFFTWLFVFLDIATQTIRNTVLLSSREMKDVVETISPETTLMVFQNPELVSLHTYFQIMISEVSTKSFCIKPNT